MLAGAVTTVDDGYRGNRGGTGRRALFVVADDDPVGVSGNNPHRVFDRLALDRGGELAGVLRRDHLAPKTQHRGFETQPGPGGWLVEKRGQDAILEQPVTGTDRAHAIGFLEQ